MLIIQSNGLNATTPARKLVGHPKVASVEQEFSDGFVKVMEDLHKHNHLCVAMNLGVVSSGSMLTSPKNSEAPCFVNLNSCSGELVNTSINTSPKAGSHLHLPSSSEQIQPNFTMHRLHTLKEEPQRVAELVNFGGSPSLHPIDMDTLERIKAERKTIRNRIAASKCRKRKLERISCLEEKVKTLKTQNTDLVSTVSLLKEQVAQLKQKVLSHVSSGCQFLSYCETGY